MNNKNSKEKNDDMLNNSMLNEYGLQDEKNKIEPNSIETELAKTKEEYAGLWNKYVRLGAELENARKRWDRDRFELIKFSNFGLLNSLLVIADEMEHALRMVQDHKDVDQVIKGVDLTAKNFAAILAKNGVVQMDTKDKKFDPFLHEIAGSVPCDKDEHIILEEIQKGYMIEDKVLRTAKVIVSVKPVKDNL